MAIILVDIKFREKAKHLLTTKEIYFCLLFLFFALINWSDIIALFTSSSSQPGVDPKAMDDRGDPHCSPKFKNLGCT